MKKKMEYENVDYTPDFSNRSTISVRRFANYINKPMTKAVDAIIEILPFMVDAEKVCKVCKIPDKCKYCTFNNPKLEQDDLLKLLAAL